MRYQDECMCTPQRNHICQDHPDIGQQSKEATVSKTTDNTGLPTAERPQASCSYGFDNIGFTCVI